MNPDDWKRVEQLFDEALEKDKEEWTRWLERECDDTLIRAEVMDMLAGHVLAGGVLEEEAQDFASDLIRKGIEEVEVVDRKRERFFWVSVTTVNLIKKSQSNF